MTTTTEDKEVDSGEALAKVTSLMLKRGDPDVIAFNTPDFCMEDILADRHLLNQYMTFVRMLSDMKGKVVEDVIIKKIPPGAPDGCLCYFAIRLRKP